MFEFINIFLVLLMNSSVADFHYSSDIKCHPILIIRFLTSSQQIFFCLIVHLNVKTQFVDEFIYYYSR